MRNPIYMLMVVCMLAGTPAWATIKGYMPDVEKVGSARLTVFLWDVYDATLYAENGSWNADRPYALTLHYLRTIEGVDIADRSAEEMRKLGFSDEVKLAAWHAQMRDIFPNVVPGTELTGMYVPDEATYFYQGDTLIGTVRDPEFGNWFFGIWLSEKTPEPELRRQLLGG